MKNKKLWLALAVAVVLLGGAAFALTREKPEKTASTEVQKETTTEQQNPQEKVTGDTEESEKKKATGGSKEIESQKQTEDGTEAITDGSEEAGSSVAPADLSTGLEWQNKTDESEIVLEEKEPETQTETVATVSLPYEVADTGLVIETIGTYTGKFVEDGSDDDVDNVSALLIRNDSGRAVQYAELHFDVAGKGEEVFELSSVPAGGKVMVFEQNRTGYSAGDSFVFTSQKTAYLDSLDLLTDTVETRVNDNNTITVKNISGGDFGTLRVYYKYQYENGTFIGGITFMAKLDGLKKGESTTISPSHFDSGGSKVVMLSMD